ncbi:MAG: type II toxin-antitoxin system death-on-curing family toxin [Firmicutes bacterium]|nr:type II toxin-antitoxin system death-on-curing family toxin [Bacillota bacterium]
MPVLSAEEILYIHYRVVKRTGGRAGVRDIGLLQSAVARPQATFDGIELYPNLFAKAAVLAHSIIQNHPFVDGNKRAGIAAAALMLRKGSFALKVAQEDMVDFVLGIAEGKVGWEEIACWLQENCVQV